MPQKDVQSAHVLLCIAVLLECLSIGSRFISPLSSGSEREAVHEGSFCALAHLPHKVALLGNVCLLLSQHANSLNTPGKPSST